MDDFLDIFFKNNQFDDIAIDFAKLFSSSQGKKVLKYLICFTMTRYLPSSVSQDELRFLEGQRYLVSFIISMIKKGQKS